MHQAPPKFELKSNVGVCGTTGARRACTTRSGLCVGSSTRHALSVFWVVTALLVSYNLCPIKEKCLRHASGIQRVNLRAVKQHGH